MQKSKNNRMYARDLSRLGLCGSGARTLLQQYGICWLSFVREGIECNVLLSLNDPVITSTVQRFLESDNG
ncbi:hypothetical protein [Enterovibrio nigricans]|uniref:hypothetical protein n=1 Tax=Enterovibrio nigricans TaxID=504469 RepID=UPI000999285F|nr:hypothetical protein [Enterovibrio nigricans]PKF48851.1 hypothetical protein AT251_23100 [Enterovibrio nigricans]